MTASILGRLLRGIRAGDRHLARNHPALKAASDTIRLRSETFGADGPIPVRCAGHGVGQNISPQLAWSGVPDATEELILIMEDSDAPLPRPVVHLMALGISPSQTSFAEGALSKGASVSVRFGVGSFGRQGYQGPRPVPGHGPHRYRFQVTALKTPLRFDQPPKLEAALAQANGNVLAWGQLIGLFER